MQYTTDEVFDFHKKLNDLISAVFYDCNSSISVSNPGHGKQTYNGYQTIVVNNRDCWFTLEIIVTDMVTAAVKITQDGKPDRRELFNLPEQEQDLFKLVDEVCHFVYDHTNYNDVIEDDDSWTPENLWK